jgi:hypothetical protein
MLISQIRFAANFPLIPRFLRVLIHFILSTFHPRLHAHLTLGLRVFQQLVLVRLASYRC